MTRPVRPALDDPIFRSPDLPITGSPDFNALVRLRRVNLLQSARTLYSASGKYFGYNVPFTSVF